MVNVPSPPLLILSTPEEYHKHYLSVYCRTVIRTFDGIRVYFSESKFGHAFYESKPGPYRKDIFSPTRAQRMDWIKATLENPNAELYVGWNKKTKAYDHQRRVSVVFGDFVVIIELAADWKTQRKAKFVTAYTADKNIGKIKSAPKWTP